MEQELVDPQGVFLVVTTEEAASRFPQNVTIRTKLRVRSGERQGATFSVNKYLMGEWII